MEIKAPVLLFALLALGPGPAWAQADAERMINLAKAATDLAKIHRQKGPSGASREINDCYAREMPNATSLTHDLETCMVQEMMFVMIVGPESRGVSPDVRKQRGLEEPEVYLQAAQRWRAIFNKFGMSADDGKKFMDLVNTRVLPIYKAAVQGRKSNQIFR
jgi:hypothetical protein